MKMNWDDLIGAYEYNCVTGEIGIVGASDRMNERYRKKMRENAIYESDVKDKIAPLGRDSYTSTPITDDNYEEIRRPKHPMPKHCYGTGFGYTQRNEINQMLQDYYTGKSVTTQELKEYFKDCRKDMRVVMAQESRTTGLDPVHNEQIILDTYEQFRMSNSVMANYGCQKEGERIAVKNGWREGEPVDWVYYNADFYYRSEELRQIFKEAAQEMAHEWKCGEIDTSTRDTDNNLSYSSSFHQVWNHSGNNGTRIMDMADLSEEPPLGFCLFFREILEGSAYYGIFQTGMEGKTDIGKKTALNPTQSYNLSTLFQKSSNNKSLLHYLRNFNAYTRYYGTKKLRKG